MKKLYKEKKLKHVTLTDLDLEGHEFKATFNSEDAGKEDIHVIEGVAVLPCLTLVLNTTRTCATKHVYSS